MRPIRVFLALLAVLLLCLSWGPVAEAGCGRGVGLFGFGRHRRAVVVQSYAYPAAGCYSATTYSGVTYYPAETVIYHQPTIYSQPAQILGPPVPSFPAAGGCVNGVCPVR